MEEKANPITSLFEKAEQYGKTSFELFKMRVIAKVADVISSAVASLTIIIIALFFITVLNIGVALWIGVSMGKLYYGFFIVAGFYAVLGILIYLCRHWFIKTPVSNSIISNAFK
jgi:hypothetical protein